MRIRELREGIERVDDEVLWLLGHRARLAAELDELWRRESAPAAPGRAHGTEDLSGMRPATLPTAAPLEEFCDLV